MKPRPKTLPSKTTCVKTGLGQLYITITELDGRPVEVFCTIGKSGASIMAKAEVTGRLASLALRNGVPVKEVIKQLIGIGGSYTGTWNGQLVESIPDAVGKALKHFYCEEVSDER